MSGGTTTDAARYKVGDIVNVRGRVGVGRNGTLFVGIPREPHSDYGPGQLAALPLADLPAENVELVPDAPAPYTEPREGDEVEVEQNPLCGLVSLDGRFACLVNDDAEVVVNRYDFATAVADGRVRLVKAAAPQFEAGRIYRDNTGDMFLYSPHPHDCRLPWFDLVRCAWSDEPTNPVPCDVVPREAT